MASGYLAKKTERCGSHRQDYLKKHGISVCQIYSGVYCKWNNILKCNIFHPKLSFYVFFYKKKKKDEFAGWREKLYHMKRNSWKTYK